MLRVSLAENAFGAQRNCLRAIEVTVSLQPELCALSVRDELRSQEINRKVLARTIFDRKGMVLN